MNKNVLEALKNPPVRVVVVTIVFIVCFIGTLFLPGIPWIAIFFLVVIFAWIDSTAKQIYPHK